MPISDLEICRRTMPLAAAWETWNLDILVELGPGSGNWDWVDFGPVTCPAGGFLSAFRALGIPEHPEWNPEGGLMRRQRTYRGRAHPLAA